MSKCLAQVAIWSDESKKKKKKKKRKKENIELWNLTGLRELYQWLALNADKQKFVIKYIYLPVGQPRTK